MKTIFVKPADVEQRWYLIDAEGLILGRLAAKVAYVLRGKHKAYYTPHQRVGDHVIVINADKVRVTGGKEQKKIYYRHSNYPGGLKSETLGKVMNRKPTFPIEQAVRGMLPRGTLGREMFRQFKAYAGASHPHAAQKPEVITI
jgi:large subunit ribosomal protein L13